VINKQKILSFKIGKNTRKVGNLIDSLSVNNLVDRAG
jgi:hypothetical protein